MLYNFLVPLTDYFSFFNLLRYISTRTLGAMFFALILTILVGPFFIRILHKLKFGQQIHEDVVVHQKKAGTPTMGGILIIFGTLLSTLFFADLTNHYIWLTLFVFIGFGFIGFVDDMCKIKHHKNLGIKARTKFLEQLIIASISLILMLNFSGYPTFLSIPFFKQFVPDLGIFYIVFAVIVLVSSSNAVNLTDGLDGLAILPVVICTGVYAVFLYVAGHANFAGYLQVAFVPGVSEVVVFCGALMGAGLGFLWYNAQPAQVFMGDVGSLSLGGVIGFLAILAKQEIILILAGGLFVIETLSVTLQVAYFKYTGGKRLFKMAPLHHHFELKGWTESKIIVRFWIISVLFALMSLSVLKIR